MAVQAATFAPLKTVNAGPLEVSYAEAGPAAGEPVILLHGWKLAASPAISVPTITMEGDANGAPHPDPATYRAKFTGRYEHRTISGGIGHNLPQEAPRDFAQAMIDVAKA